MCAGKKAEIMKAFISVTCITDIKRIKKEEKNLIRSERKSFLSRAFTVLNPSDKAPCTTRSE